MVSRSGRIIVIAAFLLLVSVFFSPVKRGVSGEDIPGTDVSHTH